MSISFETTISTETTEAEIIIEANAAAAGRVEAASPTLRQREDPSTPPLPRSQQALVVGTRSLAKRASNANLVALNSNLTKRSNNSRETPTGAGVSERGDLLIIN